MMFLIKIIFRILTVIVYVTYVITMICSVILTPILWIIFGTDFLIITYWIDKHILDEWDKFIKKLNNS